MLKRRIEKDIYEWLENSKKALLIDGARQVGKTYAIRHCLETAGEAFDIFSVVRFLVLS